VYYFLYIDDERSPQGTKYDFIARTSQDAIQIMEKHGCPIYISFDHDLSYASEYDGIGIVNWMIERDLISGGKFIPGAFHYIVHSANPIGRDNIIGKLDSYLDQRLLNN